MSRGIFATPNDALLHAAKTGVVVELVSMEHGSTNRYDASSGIRQESTDDTVGRITYKTDGGVTRFYITRLSDCITMEIDLYRIAGVKNWKPTFDVTCPVWLYVVFWL